MRPAGDTRARKVSAAIAASLLSLPPCAAAATGTGSDFDSYLRVIWGLVVVLGIILLLYGILRKRFSLLSNSSRRQEISILEMKPLMGRKFLCLVSVRGKEFLLGVSGDNISHLASFPGKTEESFSEVLRASTKKSGQ